MLVYHVPLFILQLARQIDKPANARPAGDVDILSDRVAGLGHDVSLSFFDCTRSVHKVSDLGPNPLQSRLLVTPHT
jgi:hypothetical protein